MLKTKDVKKISMDDWDQLVSGTYGRTYSLSQQTGHDEPISVIEFRVKNTVVKDLYKGKTIPDEINSQNAGVDFELWMSRDPKEWNGKESDRRYIDLFWEMNFYPYFSMLVSDLHKRGLLPLGDYLIEMD